MRLVESPVSVVHPDLSQCLTVDMQNASGSEGRIAELAVSHFPLSISLLLSQGEEHSVESDPIPSRGQADVEE